LFQSGAVNLTSGRKSVTRISLLLGAGIIAAFGLVSTGEIAHAAEVKVLASVALNSALDDLTSVYEKETGNKLSIGYGCPPI